ncbi:hypothetical protein JCM8097_004857 [Rhodosporidiobolus ruineniae]
MDDDVASLHGVASHPSDSGYASSTSRPHLRTSKRTARTTRSTASASVATNTGLNARFDQLSREMAAVADASSNDPGRSLGIKRKRIVPKRVELGGIEGRAQPEVEVDVAPPPPKRRRTLPPSRQPRNQLSIRTEEDEEDELGENQEQENPVSLRTVVSPHSGKRRTVAVEAGGAMRDPVLDTSDPPMSLPPFMLGHQSKSIQARRFSPQPDWLTQYLRPSPPQQAPRPPSLPASHFSPAPPLPAHQPFPLYYEDAFEPPPSPPATRMAYQSLPAPPYLHELHTSTPLPFSTSGRVAPQVVITAFSPPPPPAESLYESQLARAVPSQTFETPPPRFEQLQPFYHDFAPPVDTTSYAFHTEPACLEPSFDASYLPSQSQASGYPSNPHVSQPYFEETVPVEYNEDQQSQVYNLTPLHPSLHDTLAPPPPRSSSSSFDPAAFFVSSPAGHRTPQRFSEGADVPMDAPANSFWKRRPQVHLQSSQIQQQPLKPGQLRFAERLKEEAAAQIQVGALDEVEKLKSATPQAATATTENARTPQPSQPDDMLPSLRASPHPAAADERTPPPAAPAQHHLYTLPLQPRPARPTSALPLPSLRSRIEQKDENAAPPAVPELRRSRTANVERKVTSPSPRGSQEVVRRAEEFKAEKEKEEQEKQDDSANCSDQDKADSTSKDGPPTSDWDITASAHKLFEALFGSSMWGEGEGERRGVERFGDEEDAIEE